ncbi:flagellar assembly protein FliH [Pantoea sp. A4]|uniref:flagellar assembly protein FliH n=1 Tax=Pantoea sp. A4 TaxID=1225184 RepID=UPI00036914D5|nr:flagellar assembly protein FliH [Pantoea sp. A4]
MRQNSEMIRLYQFPPLRPPGGRAHHNAQQQAEFQQNVTDGFNQGLAQGLAQGEEQGYREGLKNGEQAARLQVYAELQEGAKPLENLIETLRHYLGTLEQQRRQELLQLVEKVAHQVVRCELALQPTQMLALVDEALSSLPEVPQQFKVWLSREEFGRLNELAPDKVAQWHLHPDDEIVSGECRITTPQGEMDIGCQQRLSQCLEVIQHSLDEGEEAQDEERQDA